MTQQKLPSSKVYSTPPQVMFALGRAFNAVGDKRKIQQFKDVGRELIAKANKAHFSTPPTLGDQRKARARKGPAINPAPVK